MKEENNPESSYDLVPYRKYSVIARLLAVERTTSLSHMPDDVAARSELAHSSHSSTLDDSHTFVTVRKNLLHRLSLNMSTVFRPVCVHSSSLITTGY
jgi:hypothetical protein